ncbi:hypothetical protein EST38_g10864 [Candolleomyces aberdarensis]|uniref:F-box domain-containing protein n=1 Tax=Candolleomyces aberdarensis TaxID=2316362 RepID=A0A4Q2D6D0_9AGAR|nr:hypothetical protein EST38_g10864 [Candolleomyces aberdarensis]
MEPPENKVEATTLTSLPPELLGEIFYHCSAFSPDAPLLLSRVSKSFHQVVHSTPNVWQRLSLKTNLVRDTGCAEEKATFWLSKVGSCLVDVKVEIVQSQSAVSGTTTPVTHPSSHHLPLLGVLKAHVQHIRSLDVASASELDARVFLNAIYEAPPASTSTTAIQLGDDIISLESLNVSVSSTTPPNLRLSSSFVKFPLQILLPKLQSLSLTNHTIDFLVSCATATTSTPSIDSITDSSTISTDLSLKTSFGTGTFENLRHLSVICPIRFAPLQVSSILTILRNSPRLEELVVESRMVSEGPSIGSDASSNSTPAVATAGGPPTPTSAVGPAPEFLNNSEAEAVNGGNTIDSSSLSIASTSSPPTPTAATTNTPTLVHLPHLTSLSLRTNAIPSILSQLLLPNLDRLHLEDLNGKRAGGSKETADVLRQVLVRMELPNAYHKKERSIGLRVLEVGGVDITVGGGGGGGNSGQIERDAKTTWEWCFKRMVTLEELAVGKMSDPMSLFELFAPLPSPPSPIYPTSASHGGFDGLYHHSTPSTPVCPSPVDTVCPLLRRFSITSTTCLTSSDLQKRLIIDRFKTTRSNVELDVEVVKDPFYQSMLTGPVDFLSLYSDMTVPRPTGTQESFGAKRGSTMRKPAAKSFGPWVVLN